jgi:hypothetical protein
MRLLLLALVPFGVAACDRLSSDRSAPSAAAAPSAPSATASATASSTGAVGTASAAASAASSQDKLSDFPPVSYATYQNPRFGFAVQHPTFMTALPPPTNGDGQEWVWGNHAKMTASGINNVANETVEAFCTEAAKRKGNSGKIVNNGACLVTGKYGGKIYWSKTHFVDDKEITILLEYDEAFKTNFDPIIHQVAVTIKLK